LVFFSLNFFTPKFVKISCYSFFLGLLHLTSKSSWAHTIQVLTSDIGHLTNYGQMLIFELFGHFHTEVNPKMISNLSRRASESLKIENISKNRINIFCETIWELAISAIH
jgi:hypothetical protein